jgi:hypothetical protein
MKRLILCFAISLLMLHVGAQSAKKTRTITASISKHGTISGDTTFFSYYGPTGDLIRFFNRNLRIPLEEGTGELEYGSCNLYFMIDKAGNVTKTWCDSVTNQGVEKEILRVAGKLAWIKPTKIKGKPVVTKVIAAVIMMHANESDSYKDVVADIIVIGYDPQRKKSIAAF